MAQKADADSQHRSAGHPVEQNELVAVVVALAADARPNPTEATCTAGRRAVETTATATAEAAPVHSTAAEVSATAAEVSATATQTAEAGPEAVEVVARTVEHRHAARGCEELRDGTEILVEGLVKRPVGQDVLLLHLAHLLLHLLLGANESHVVQCRAASVGQQTQIRAGGRSTHPRTVAGQRLGQ